MNVFYAQNLHACLNEKSKRMFDVNRLVSCAYFNLIMIHKAKLHKRRHNKSKTTNINQLFAWLKNTWNNNEDEEVVCRVIVYL